MHMWFIYYLIWFCLLAAAVASIVPRIPAGFLRAVDACFVLLAMRWWGLVFFSVPLAIIGSGYRAGIVAPTGSFIPTLNERAQHGLFFAFGIMLHRHEKALFPVFMKRSWPYLLAGSAVFIVVLGALKVYTTNRYAVADFEFGIALFYNLTSWFWSLALIGLFLRFMQSQNRVLRYVSDSSYWVFLVHMLGTIGFSVAMLNLPTGPVAKMALNIVATSAVCLVTYQLLVRHTLIGVLLNGRRHVKGNRATPADAVVIRR